MEGHQHESREDRRFRIPTKWVLVGFLAIAGYFLITEHRAHAIQYLPFLLLALCPLLHLFHNHGGHGGHKHGDEDRGKPARRERTEGDSQ
jgi:hypothetical protein